MKKNLGQENLIAITMCVDAWFAPQLCSPFFVISTLKQRMRGLNLSRLARTSESSFFKHEQAAQTSRLRERLVARNPSLLELLSSPSSPPDTLSSKAESVDVLMEISAHRVYRKLADNTAKLDVAKRSGRVLSKDSVNTPSLSVVVEGTRQGDVTPDTNVLRALGPARLAVYEQVSRNVHQVRALPGSEKYTEGATLGLISFGVATLFVASVGFAGGVVLYMRPGIIESWKLKTIKWNDRLDATIGERLRHLSKNASQKSQQVVSDEQRKRASAFARAIVKPRSRDKDAGPIGQNY